MDIRHEDQQRRQQLLTIVDRGNAEQLFVSVHSLDLLEFPRSSVAELLATVPPTAVSELGRSDRLRRRHRRSDRFHRLHGNEIQRHTADHRCRQGLVREDEDLARARRQSQPALCDRVSADERLRFRGEYIKAAYVLVTRR